jgi:hypothetical protein
MRKFIFLLSSFNWCLFCFGQENQGKIDYTMLPALKAHYDPELTLDKSSDNAAWMNVKSGLQVSYASTNEHYFRSDPPKIEMNNEWRIKGWRGERVNELVLTWSADSLQQVRFIVQDLRNKNGQLISKKNIHISMVRYVLSNYPYNARNVTCDVTPYKDAYLMPDRLESFDQFDLPAKSVRPVWVSVDIPSEAQPGDYTGTLEVHSLKYVTRLQINLTVQHMRLPPPHEWKYRLDLWQNPWVVARYNHLTPWSVEHKMLLRKHLALYADAGGKYITTYAIHSPWADNSYQIEETMIDWIRKANGQWKFDYSIFDDYVSLAMQLGIDKAITIYTPVPWGDRFRYKDEKSGNFVYATWKPGTPEYAAVWNQFLTDLEMHLKKKGWFEKTYLGINENEMEQTLAAIRVIRAHSNKWKITYAGNWHQELDTLLNDYCFLYGNEPGTAVVKARQARGFTSTYYICCNPPKPNDFLFSPPVEGRWLSWYAAAHQYNGFLRWAYDAWPADPLRDGRHIIWPAGDCFLVYPGGASCIRFEKLREGIADYEKIRLVREAVSKSGSSKAKQLMKSLYDHLELILGEHEFETEQVKQEVENGLKILDNLSDALSN